MKDYYYILGIKTEASVEEIKKAYRKLSLKFHPDKNDGDEFFVERFKELQEAYETLNNFERRKAYDYQFLLNRQSQTVNNGHNFDPVIIFFKTSKASFDFEEEVIFSWTTVNADSVNIKPFGAVQPIGQKTFKFKNFKNAELHFELIAENTNTGRVVRQILSLTNNTYLELYSHFKGILIAEDSASNKQSSNPHKKNSVKNVEYYVIKEEERYDIAWGNFHRFEIKFLNGMTSEIYKGKNSNKFFYFNLAFGKKYCDNMEDAFYKLHLYLKEKEN